MALGRKGRREPRHFKAKQDGEPGPSYVNPSVRVGGGHLREMKYASSGRSAYAPNRLLPFLSAGKAPYSTYVSQYRAWCNLHRHTSAWIQSFRPPPVSYAPSRPTFIAPPAPRDMTMRHPVSTEPHKQDVRECKRKCRRPSVRTPIIVSRLPGFEGLGNQVYHYSSLSSLV